MNAGELDRRVDLKTKTVTRDSWNHPEVAYVTLDTVWAKKLERLAGEKIGENQLVSSNRVEWTIRYRNDISADSYIEYDSQKYWITATREIGRKELLLIFTELRDNA